MRDESKACLDLAAAMVIVGSSVVAGKMVLASMPLYTSQALRFALACLVLLPLLFLREGGLPRLSPGQWGVVAGLAACGSLLFNVFLLHGLRLTSAAAAGIIASTTPACMALIAVVFLRERLSFRAWSGVGLAVAGVAALNLAAKGDGGASSLAGNLLVLCAVLAESLFLLLRRALPPGLSPLCVATLVSLAALTFFVPLALLELAGGPFPVIDLRGWLVVAYYGLVITILAYVFWFRGVTRVSPATAAVMTGIMPVAAACLSWAVLGEEVRPEQVAGCTLVLGGILCMALPGQTARPRVTS